MSNAARPYCRRWRAKRARRLPGVSPARPFLGAYRWKHPGTGRSSLRFAFIGSVSDHDALQPLDHGILRTHWLTRLQLLAHEARLRSPLVLRCIDDYLAGQRQPLLAVGHLDMDGARDVPAVEVT